MFAGSNDAAAISLTESVRLVLAGRENALVEFQIALVDLEHMRGNRARLDHDLFGGQVERRAGHGGRARATGAFAIGHQVGVALHVMHVVGIEAEPVAHQLLEYGLVALSLRVGAGEYGQRAGAVEAHLGAFRARGGGALDSVG